MIEIQLLKDYPDSISSLAAIWCDVLGQKWMPDVGVQEMETYMNGWLNEGLPLGHIAFSDGMPVGMCSLQWNDGIRDDLKPWLSDLVIDPAYQKQGIAKMLIDATKDKARSLGFEKLYLFAFDPLVSEYYGRLGWKKIGMDKFARHEVMVMEIDIRILGGKLMIESSSVSGTP